MHDDDVMTEEIFSFYEDGSGREEYVTQTIAAAAAAALFFC